MEKTIIRLLDNVNEVGLYGKDRISIFRNSDIEALPSDLAILSGAKRDSLGFSPYWTSTSGRILMPVITSTHYSTFKHFEATRYAKSPTIRPVIEYELLEDKSIVKGDINEDDIVTIGEYPLFIETDEDKIVELERIARLSKRYMTTTKSYHFDFINQNQEFVLDNQKYIKYVCKGDDQLLSNGEKCEKGKVYWVKVMPVPYLVDKEKKLLISKYGLLSGISYWLDDCDNEEVRFEKSNMYAFLSDKMLDDLITVSEIRKKDEYSSYIVSNPFNFQNNKLSYSDVAQELLKSGIAPFFHGDTGVGKSARVYQIDPDAITIYLCAQNPQSMGGKTVYIQPVVKRNGDKVEIIAPGRMQEMKPSWLKKAEKLAKDGKLHLLFFDEITNAPLAIQGFCFNIILEHEVNGIWELPSNFGVIAAGNEVDDSLSANELAEPLFSRFGHIYIEDRLDEWLEWAISENIHPAIIAYMTYTNGANLRTKYTGTSPNADPRKWEMSSKVLYETKNISLLNGLIGDEVTMSFIEFCKCKPISLEDVLNGNYDDNTFIMDANKKYITALSLSQVDMDNFEKVDEFMLRVGEEPCALFESLWAKNDQERLTKLYEIKELRRLTNGNRREDELERRVLEYHYQRIQNSKGGNTK